MVEIVMEIFIVDDCRNDRNDLIKILQKLLRITNTPAHIKVQNGIGSLFSNIHKCDLLFLDMVLGSINGLDIGYEIKKIHPECRIVIITSFDQYSKQGYKIHADRFLSKPFNETEVLTELSGLFEEYFRNLRCIKDSNLHPSKIFVKDILYVEAINKRTRLHMTNGKEIPTPYTLKHWISELENSGFCRSHKSFLINLNYVSEATNTDVVLYSDELVPLSRNFKKDFERSHLDYLYKAI